MTGKASPIVYYYRSAVFVWGLKEKRQLPNAKIQKHWDDQRAGQGYTFESMSREQRVNYFMMKTKTLIPWCGDCRVDVLGLLTYTGDGGGRSTQNLFAELFPGTIWC